tara:strand:- start:1027 stop:1593 length:567 start_codon:yes stop_codon:yes gene_type:complete
MKSRILFIHDSVKLFEIFNEIKEFLNFEIEYFNSNNIKKLNLIDNKNYLVISMSSCKGIGNCLFLKDLPLNINKLLEKINLTFLKNQFNNQSEVMIGKYILDLNSRKIIYGNKILNLTEKETDLILFINLNKKSSLKDLQEKVWKYSVSLETHTVETHIYRLRKKMLEIFEDKDFIKFDNKYYFLNLD